MKIAIASGKGGTGKTTVSINLYYFLSRMFDNKVQLIDCDVEEPNDLLFFPKARVKTRINEYTFVPAIDTNKCTFCKKCSEWCEFNAITLVKNLKFADINSDLCHSCGACLEACSNNAITEKQEPLGVVSKYDVGFGMGITEGRLEIGSAMQTALIKKVKKNINPDCDITLYDAPPGTSCPVVETVADVDFVILVTEPTPFGLHDLKITVALLNKLHIKFGVIVNKAHLGSNETYSYLKEESIPLLGEIPFSKTYATNYSDGKLLKAIPTEIEKTYQKIIQQVTAKLKIK